MKTLFFAICAITTATSFANSHPVPSPRPHPPHPVHHSHDFWGKGGQNFWSGFIGGIVGSAVFRQPNPPPPVSPAPVVVVQPTPVVVIPQNKIWVPAHWENQVQPDGRVIAVWIPGYWK